MVMKMWRIWPFLFCVTIILLSGCSVEKVQGLTPEINGSEVELTPVKGGTLKLAMREAKTLNPLLNTEATVNQVLHLIYDSLIEYDDNYKPIPKLASGWSFSPDGTILTVELKNGVQWHDGRPFTAQDVIFSLNVIKDIKNNSPYQKNADNIISYSAEGSHRIRIVFAQPFTGALDILDFPVIPSHYYGNDVVTSPNNMKPIGTGAYKFKEYRSLKYMNLEANEGYFDGAPYISSVNVKIVPDEKTALSGFDQKQLDVIGTDIVDWEKYTEMNQTQIYEYVSRHYDFIGFNFKNPTFSDPNIRRAIAQAIDREELIKQIYLGHAKIVDVPINPSSYLYNKNSYRYKYNLEAAQSLLKNPATSEPRKIAFTLLVNEESPEKVAMAELIKNNLNKVGINMIIKKVAWEEYLSHLENKNYDAFLGSWKLSYIPDLTFAFHTMGNRNFLNYSNPIVDSSLQSAFQAIQEEAKIKAFSKLQNDIASELPYVSLCFRTSALITNDRIKGTKAPVGNHLYRQVHKWFDISVTEKEEQK